MRVLVAVVFWAVLCSTVWSKEDADEDKKESNRDKRTFEFFRSVSRSYVETDHPERRISHPQPPGSSRISFPNSGQPPRFPPHYFDRSTPALTVRHVGRPPNQQRPPPPYRNRQPPKPGILSTPPYAVQMEPMVQYSPRDPLYHRGKSPQHEAKAVKTSENSFNLQKIDQIKKASTNSGFSFQPPEDGDFVGVLSPPPPPRGFSPRPGLSGPPPHGHPGNHHNFETPLSAQPQHHAPPKFAPPNFNPPPHLLYADPSVNHIPQGPIFVTPPPSAPGLHQIYHNPHDKPYYIIKEPEPIIEIIVKESNVTLPPIPTPPTPPPPPSTKEPVHVFYVKYKKGEQGQYGETTNEKLHFEQPVPAHNPSTYTVTEAPQPLYTTPVSYHDVVTEPPTPPPPTTLRTIIRPDSERYHTSGLHVSFQQPTASEYGPQPDPSNQDSLPAYQVQQSAPQPAFQPTVPPSHIAQHQSAGFQQHPLIPVPFEQVPIGFQQIPPVFHQQPSAPVATLQPNAFHVSPGFQHFPAGPTAASFIPPTALQSVGQSQQFGPVGGFSGNNPSAVQQHGSPSPNGRAHPQPVFHAPQHRFQDPQQNLHHQQLQYNQQQQHQQQQFQQHHQQLQHQQQLEQQRQQQLQQPQVHQQQHHHQQQVHEQQEQQRLHQQQEQQRLHQQQEQQRLQQQQEQQRLQQQQQEHQQRTHHIQQQEQQQQQQQHHNFQQQEQQIHHHQKQEQQKQQQQEQQKNNQQKSEQQHHHNQQQQQLQPQQQQNNHQQQKHQSQQQHRQQHQLQHNQQSAGGEIVKSISIEPHSQSSLQQQPFGYQPEQSFPNFNAPSFSSSGSNAQISTHNTRVANGGRTVEQQPFLPTAVPDKDREIKQSQPSISSISSSSQTHTNQQKQQQHLVQQQQQQQKQQQHHIQQQKHQQHHIQQQKQQQHYVQQQKQETQGEPEKPKDTQTPSEEPKSSDNLVKSLAALPDEVPEDLRQQLLSSGILNNADIQILDYDKVGDIPIESLPPEALESLYGAGSDPVPSIVRPDATGPAKKANVEMKVVRYDPTKEEIHRYVKQDAAETTQVDPVVLNDQKYNRYLPLKVNGAKFPVPNVPELQGKNITSVVVLAPVDYDFQPGTDEERFGRQVSERGTAVEVHDVKFFAGQVLKTLVKNPTKENFEQWLDSEKKAESDKQSVVLLVANKSSDNAEDNKDIFMYDVTNKKVNRLKGELSTAFVDVAESNAKSEELDDLSVSASEVETRTAAPGGVTISSGYSKTSSSTPAYPSPA